jgi:hypothetical protein
MSLEKITQVTGRGVYVPGNDIDTDRIIPARFMKCVTFDGLGEGSSSTCARPPTAPAAAPAGRSREFKGAADPALRRQLRLRQLARARAAGDPEVRLPRGRRGKLRRDLLRQLDHARHALRERRARGHRRRSPRRSRRIPALELTVDLAALESASAAADGQAARMRESPAMRCQRPLGCHRRAARRPAGDEDDGGEAAVPRGQARGRAPVPYLVAGKSAPPVGPFSDFFEPFASPRRHTRESHPCFC